MNRVKLFFIALSAMVVFQLSCGQAANQRKSVTLEANTAEIQKFSTDVREIFVANPEVADVQLNSPQIAYIFAKKPGSTTVFATDVDGKVVLNMDITVVDNLTHLNKAMNMVAPNESVKALSTPHG